MDLLSSILATEAEHGPVDSIAVPTEYADALIAEMTAADRLDLVPLITVGGPGWLVVTVAGRAWPYGGL